jgi:hypothetical protein
MRIRYMSDLHMEMRSSYPVTITSIGEDVVVLAGDIGVGCWGIEWAKLAFWGRPVIYVLGNHEYYRYSFRFLPEKARHAAAVSNVHFLENDSVLIGGYRFLGCTLWTDFELFGAQARGDAMQTAEQSMRDYRLITYGRSKVTPELTRARCLESVEWLRSTISSSDEPTVVVTHMAPTIASKDPQRRPDDLTPCFHNAFEDLIQPPVSAWIHGHNHYSTRVAVNGIPVMSNQRGYPGEGLTFSWDCYIDLP